MTDGGATKSAAAASYHADGRRDHENLQRRHLEADV